MSPEKIQQLLADRDTLDGELHSLGFVFVRQTVREFAADLSIESELDKGTTMTIRFPCVPGTLAVSRPSSNGSAGHLAPRLLGPLSARPESHSKASAPAPAATTRPSDGRTYGRIILRDYEICEGQYPGTRLCSSIVCRSSFPMSRTWSKQNPSHWRCWRVGSLRGCRALPAMCRPGIQQ
jgi:hypothetical protein